MSLSGRLASAFNASVRAASCVCEAANDHNSVDNRNRSVGEVAQKYQAMNRPRSNVLLWKK